MGFRTLEIGQAAEIHINHAQLEVTTQEGISFIPLEDLEQIMAHGANIRLSTMDLSILTKNKVGLLTLDEKYLPTALVLPFEGHSRQAQLMHAQVDLAAENQHTLWCQIIRQKISNQARALSILGKSGAEELAQYIPFPDDPHVDAKEALAAKTYFDAYHKGLNRRTNDPINSRLNYGYAVIRSAIARKLVATGFHPTFGLHHNSQLNAFNLADDLIEPYRPFADLAAHENIGSSVHLSKAERYALAHTLHNACIMDGVKMNVLSAIGLMVESLKRIVLDGSSEELKLPVIIPIESMEGITE